MQLLRKYNVIFKKKCLLSFHTRKLYFYKIVNAFAARGRLLYMMIDRPGCCLWSCHHGPQGCRLLHMKPQKREAQMMLHKLLLWVWSRNGIFTFTLSPLANMIHLSVKDAVNAWPNRGNAFSDQLPISPQTERKQYFKAVSYSL